MSRIAFSCDCGGVRGTLEHVAARGTHIACHCADCRAEARHHGRDWDPEAGNRVWHTAPDLVTVEAGADRLAAIKVKPKGFPRWYAACCGTPLFATVDTRQMPFIGIDTARLETDAPLGPVMAESYVNGGVGKTRHRGFGRILRGIMARALAARLSGRWKRSPVFDEAGGPIGPIRELTEAEKAAAYA